jgi:hypothetical protein
MIIDVIKWKRFNKRVIINEEKGEILNEKTKTFISIDNGTDSVLTPSVFAAEPPDGMINISDSSEWQGSVFGNLGGNDNVSAEFFSVTENDNDTVTIKSSENKGKIDSGTEGLAYYYQEVDPNANFELTATVNVDAWTANNQVSFGIMLRSNILLNENNSSFNGDFVSVGAIYQQMEAFYREGGSLTKSGYEFTGSNNPASDEEYDLKIKKFGDYYSVTIGMKRKLYQISMETLHMWVYIVLGIQQLHLVM